MLNLTRDGEVTDFRRFPTEGVDTTRFSLDTGWQRTLYSDSGFVTDVTGAVRGDLYWSNDLPESSTSTEVEDGVTAGRFYPRRSEEHTSELQSLMRISYAVFCLKKKNTTQPTKIQ